jgi:hypothetical protein
MSAPLPIPAWPDPSSPEGLRFFDGANSCLILWIAKGVSMPFALGMIAQAEAESSFDPNAMGDYPNHDHTKAPTAFGLYQLHSDRLAAIKAGTSVDIEALVRAKQCTFQHCIDAAWWEFTHMHWAGMATIAAQKTAYGAAYQACALFERAGAEGAAQRRGHMAERWTMHFAKKGFR